MGDIINRGKPPEANRTRGGTPSPGGRVRALRR
nr:MAG TPA: hypothetical protein [Caudoviricetes sp.]